MPLNFGRFAQGAGSGAVLGSMIPGGTIPGAIIGGISSLFGKSPEEERQDRLNDLLQKIKEYRSARLTSGISDISRNTAAMTSGAREAAGRRALAMGRSNDAESFIAPVEGQYANEGSNAIRRFSTDTNNYFDNAAMSAEQGFANRPIEPSVTDYLTQAGAMYVGVQQNKDSLDIMRQRNEILKNYSAGKAGADATDYFTPAAGKYYDANPYGGGNQETGYNYDSGVNLRASLLRLPRYSMG